MDVYEWMVGVRCFNFGVRTPLHNRRDDDDVDANAITMDGCNRARVGSFHKFSRCTCFEWLVLQRTGAYNENNIKAISRTLRLRCTHTHTHTCIRSLDSNSAPTKHIEATR